MGRLAAGTMQVDPVQLKDDPFSFQTYDVGLLLQVAARGGDAEPSVTDGDAGVIEVHADRACELTVIVALAATVPVPVALFAVTVTP